MNQVTHPNRQQVNPHTPQPQTTNKVVSDIKEVRRQLGWTMTEEMYRSVKPRCF
ncbi:MAG: hypothetical protein K2P84_01765 [Undibacterium sp.]|nr:hypothetical protein [Undibacterium sp.]